MKFSSSYLRPRNRVHFLSTFEADSPPFRPIQPYRERSLRVRVNDVGSVKYKKKLEARVGIEPTRKGFADLSLTTWVPRRSLCACSRLEG